MTPTNSEALGDASSGDDQATNQHERAKTEDSESSGGCYPEADMHRTIWKTLIPKEQDVEHPPEPHAFVVRSALVHAYGLDRDGRRSLDPVHPWTLHAFFNPTLKTAFLKLRSNATLQATKNDKHYLYMFIPPEIISSLTVDGNPNDWTVSLRLALRRRADLVGPSESLGLSSEADDELLAHARWLASRPVLAIDILGHSRVSLESWQRLSQACTDGSLQSDPDISRIQDLYGGQGGHLLNVGAGVGTPPPYEDLASTRDAEPPSRKRQRDDSSPPPDGIGKDVASWFQTLCDKTVVRQRDEMIVPFLLRMKEMEDRIIDTVADRMESLVEKRLDEIREDLQCDWDNDLDNRVDAVKEEVKDSLADLVEEQLEEQLEDQRGLMEDSIVDTVMDRLKKEE